MFGLKALVEAFDNNTSTPYNPIPLYDYLRKQWLDLTTQLEFHKYLMGQDLRIPIATINEFLQQDIPFIISNNPFQFINNLKANCKLLLQSIALRMVPNLQQHVDKTIKLLEHLIDLFAVLEIHLGKNPTPKFATDYTYALVLPGGHCRAISRFYAQEITPDPKTLRDSSHQVKYVGGVYFFGVNSPTKPSAEEMVRSLITDMGPSNQGLFPVKSPCFLLNRAVNGSKIEYTYQLLHLSLEVKGVTLRSLLLAHDAFQVIAPHSKNSVPDAVLNTLKELIVNPPNDALFTIEELSISLAKQYPKNTDYVDRIHTFLDCKLTTKELYLALVVLQLLKEKPAIDELNEWLPKVIPHITSLMELLKHYGMQLDNTAFRSFLDQAPRNIDPLHIQLLGLVCSMLFAHDAAGTNFIVDLHKKPYTMSYIDGDDGMVDVPITRKQSVVRRISSTNTPKLNSSANRLIRSDELKITPREGEQTTSAGDVPRRFSSENSSTAESFTGESSSCSTDITTSVHFAKSNSIVSAMSQFHDAPLHPDLIKTMRATTAEELFFSCINRARELERIYNGLLLLFPIPGQVQSELYIPLKLSATVAHNMFRTFQAVVEAFHDDKCTTAIAVLQSALPNTGEICVRAHKDLRLVSEWTHKFFSPCPSLEELLNERTDTALQLLASLPFNLFEDYPDLRDALVRASKPVVPCAYEVGDCASKRHDFYKTPYIMKLYLLQWMVYTDISDPAFKRLLAAIEPLAKEGLISPKEFTSIKQKKPRLIDSCAPYQNDDPETPESESPMQTPRASDSPKSGRPGLFNNLLKRVNSSSEIILDASQRLQRTPSQSNLSGSVGPKT